MAYTQKTRTPYKKMYIKGKYEDFSDFYDINKETIYKSIVEIFENFKETKNDYKILGFRHWRDNPSKQKTPDSRKSRGYFCNTF